MGNTKSSHVDFQHSEKIKRTKMEKMRSALRNALHTDKENSNKDKNKKPIADITNNNNTTPSFQSSYYPNDNVGHSSTLPAYTNGYGPRHDQSDETDRSATLKARLLPAYKDQHPVTSGTLDYRQRIHSSSSYTPRARTSSQSSSYSRRYNTSSQRVVSTHIPDRLDKKLVRSKSVGVIPDTEIKMRQTKSASVVKLSEVEDWIV